MNILKLYYSGSDLGPVYRRNSTSFRVWSPVADNVKLVIYERAGEKNGSEFDMLKDTEGTWTVTVKGDLKNKYYMYRINIAGDERESVDPYAKCLAANGLKGMVVDLSETDPDGWADDKRPEFGNPVDAVIYEIHIRDFTIAESSGVKDKGKYIGFAEPGTRNPHGLKTGVDHLKELGVTHVQLMPVMDFSSVDETRGNSYNWGYDPFHYFSPEGWYATDAAGGANRIRELKQMIKELHDSGIRVVLDVVYNHTHHVGNSPFDMIVPKYYYRTDAAGNYSNGSGCFNETASERPMVRKLILDSLKYWALEYHVDGFRFDLMALHDMETMSQVEKQLHAIDKSILIYGEPWNGGYSTLDTDKRVMKGRQSELNIAVFNDNFRDAIKGSTKGADGGYVSGNSIEKLEILKGITGEIPFDGYIEGFTTKPTETLNYTSCHDDLCLWDKLVKSNPHANEEELISMHLLANTFVLTAQGIAFMHGGDECLRTKQGVENSYCSPDKINRIDWDRKTRYFSVFEYYKGLIHLRRNHPAFRMVNAESVTAHLCFLQTPDEAVTAFWLKGYANGDPWRNVIVILNASKVKQKINLPVNGLWNIAADSSTRTCTGTIIDSFTGCSMTVPPIAAIIAYSNG